MARMLATVKQSNPSIWSIVRLLARQPVRLHRTSGAHVCGTITNGSSLSSSVSEVQENVHVGFAQVVAIATSFFFKKNPGQHENGGFAGNTPDSLI